MIKNSVFIRKVILENFLSFQRDEVSFLTQKNQDIPRFILIVGPNWSGKTSIFQAIKFALGSNERDERYKKWSDFIRDGQKHAMVELQIQHYNEVIKIRRTVIRGKSPSFEIQLKNDKNFKKVHAIEIQKLVSKLEINPDNQFAFVSQGKIDTIKSLKPIELCSFLEEGIGLKGLREEILQQKNSVFTLNTEFKSLITRKNSLNINLDFLMPKLERLDEKKKLLVIRKKYNDELLWANKSMLQKEIEVLELNVKKSQDQINIITNEIDKYRNLIKEKEKKISEIDSNLLSSSKKVGELNYRKKELVNKIDAWQNEKLRAKQELDVLSGKISEYEKIIDKLEKQRQNIISEIDIVKKKKISIKNKIDKLIKEQNEITIKIKENQDFLEKYNKLTYEKENNVRKIQDNENNIKNIQRDINDIFQSLTDIDYKLEKNRWFLENPTKDLLTQLDKELKKVSGSLFKSISEVEQLEYEKSKKIIKFKLLQTALRERKIVLSANINILKEEIKKRELDDRVKGPIIEYLKYDDELSYAIESVLGERLLNSFIANDWDTLNLVEKLKKKYNAYCNIYIPKDVRVAPLPKIMAQGVIGYLAELIKVVGGDLDVQKVIYSKIKNCVVVKDYTSAKELYKSHNFKGKCVTLKGKQIISYKYAYESPFIRRLKGLLSPGTQKEQSNILEKEINSLNDNILELKVKQSQLDNLQGEIFRKKESFNDLLYNFKQKERLTSKKNQFYNLVYSLEQNITETNEKIEDIVKKINELESQKEPEFFKWNEKIKEIPIELNNLNNDLKKWDTKLDGNLGTLKDIDVRINPNKNELRILKKDFDSKKVIFKNSDKKAFEIYRKLDAIDEEINKVDANILNLQDQKIAFQKDKSEIDKKHIQVKLSLEQETFKRSSIKLELGAKKNDLERINSEIGPLISEKKMDIRTIEEIDQDILIIAKKLLNYLDVDDSILVEKEQILTGLKEITKNQKDIERDIKAAIKTEKKLEETYYKKFKLVLKDLNLKINQKFISANIKAYCTLDLIGNFEALGIDIKAAISKDKLKSCTALSGGQISMISISLILSLQEIKPSPLCMFDEAGMFLDEKNSEASYQMIRTTIEHNAIQMLMFLPKSSNPLYLLADKLIGVARVGKNEVSTIFNPKIVKERK